MQGRPTTGDPSPAQAAADTETETTKAPDLEVSRWRAVEIRVRNIEYSVPPQRHLRAPFHADVIVGTVNSKGETEAKVLLEDVLVLSGPDVTADSQPQFPYTLRLMPEDMLKLRLAQETGSISLSLRSPSKHKR